MKTPNIINTNLQVEGEMKCSARLQVGQVVYAGGRYMVKTNIVAKSATDGTGAGAIINSAAATAIPASAFLPSVGCVARIGHTGNVTDTLPTAAAIIAAVNPVMPGGTWQVGQRYSLIFANIPTSTYTWTLSANGDANIAFQSGSATTSAFSGNTNTANYKLFWIVRASSTDVLIYEV